MNRLATILLLALAGCEWVRLPPDDGVYDADGDGYDSIDDCDDFNENVHPLASDRCNGTDNNCSGSEDDAEDADTWYPDVDGDGWGDAGAPLRSCTPPLGYVEASGDCDDENDDIHPRAPEPDCSDPVDYDCDGWPAAWDSDLDGTADCEDCADDDATVFPGAAERCNNADDDCDGAVDEDTALLTWYRDVDGDGWGDPTLTLEACERPSGYSAVATDCDDTDPAEHPSAPEACDGADNDCDGVVDEEDRFGNDRWYLDRDGDGFGDAADWVASCAPVADRIPDGSDCDDTNGAIAPGAAEVCDEVDQDCDGTADDDATDMSPWYRDADRDGYGDASVVVYACSLPSGYAADQSDCDDANRRVNPAAAEACGGGDEDCDGTTDEDGATGGSSWYPDADGDGYGDEAAVVVACSMPAGTIAAGGDCDDTDDLVHPDALEIDCSDPTDFNCDGSVGRVDADGDGWDACEDCSDADPGRSPEATETCDGLDEDCDGDVDDDASDATAWYPDLDGDGYGEDAGEVYACDAPASSVSVPGDCDDDNAAVSPGDAETCATDDDDDCDGDTNVGGLGCTDFHPDVDGDGYGGADSLCLCVAEAPYTVSDGSDCEDEEITVNPDGVESCGNGLDDDCDGLATGCGIAGELALADADATLTGEATSDLFGQRVLAAGDLDGDGYGDLLVGAPNYDGPLTDGGGAWLFAGPLAGTLALSDATVAWSGASDDAGAGYALSVGDLDGDGVSDLVVGAPYADDAGSGAGTVHVVIGPLDTDAALSAADRAYTGTDTNDLAGMSVAVLDDADGDGTRELAVGAYRESSRSGSAGIVYLLDRTAARAGSLDAEAYATLSGQAGGDFFGRVVIGAGDLDGDGLEDVAVGAYADDNGGTNAGAVYVFTGTLSGAHTTADAVAARYGAARSDSAGLALAGRGDLDGDGYDDLVVAAHNNDDAAYNAGAVYVVPGPITGASSLASELTLLGEDDSDTAGTALAIGDLDGDGFDDLAIGGNGAAHGNVGIVWVTYGPLAGTSSLGDLPTFLLGESSAYGAGNDLAIGTDANGDGYGELYVGASIADHTADNAGATYVVGGGPGL